MSQRWVPKPWFFTCRDFSCSLLTEHVNTNTDVCCFCPHSIQLPFLGNSTPIFLWETTSPLSEIASGIVTWPMSGQSKHLSWPQWLGSGMSTDTNQANEWNSIQDFQWNHANRIHAWPQEKSLMEKEANTEESRVSRAKKNWYGWYDLSHWVLPYLK